MYRAARLLAVIMLAAPLSTLAAGSGQEHHHGHSTVEQPLELNAGKKWEGDAVLRQSMSAIRSKVASALDSVHAQRLDAAGRAALASTIGEQVAHIVKNCRLEPAADAQLHVVLARLMAGVEAVEGKAQGVSPEQGVVQLARTLNTYGNNFEHAGWQPINLSH